MSEPTSNLTYQSVDVWRLMELPDINDNIIALMLPLRNASKKRIWD